MIFPRRFCFSIHESWVEGVQPDPVTYCRSTHFPAERRRFKANWRAQTNPRPRGRYEALRSLQPASFPEQGALSPQQTREDIVGPYTGQELVILVSLLSSRKT